MESKCFVIRKSLIGKGEIINVSFKSGKKFSYSHDMAYEVMRGKLDTMNCFTKYKSYTSSSSVPTILRDKVLLPK